MQRFLEKKVLVVAGVLVVFLVATALIVKNIRGDIPETPTVETPEETVEPEVITPRQRVIGTSVEGRAIDAYTYGTGNTHLVFVGGIHGGYEWNSVLLSYQFIDYLHEHPDSVPNNLTVTVIPSANPDGVFAVIGKEGRFTLADVPVETKTGLGRFNAHKVDLNRNFDCKWQPESMWRGNTVSAGTAAFSEPEAVAIRDFMVSDHPTAVVFWHSQSNAVYASECKNGILPETLTLMNTYSSAAQYPAISTFDAYPVTGDAEGWLASINIPAVTVELSTHSTIEWDKNFAGIEALFAHYGQETNLSR